MADTFPASLTCTWTCAGAGGGTCTAIGAGNINDSVNLPAGGTVTYTATCRSRPGDRHAREHGDRGERRRDPNPANNSATDTDTLTPSADLAITKTDGVTTATPGGSTTYTITASNAGPSNSPGTTVADTFPAPLTCTWTCAGAGGGTCTAAGAGNINDPVTLPVGGSVTYTATCTIWRVGDRLARQHRDRVRRRARSRPRQQQRDRHRHADADGRPRDHQDRRRHRPSCPGGRRPTRSRPRTPGRATRTGATVADTFPASLTCNWTCAGAGGGTCTAAGAGNINDTVNLPVGGSVTYTAACNDQRGGDRHARQHRDRGRRGATDPTPGNNSATDTDTLAGQADTSVTMTVDNPTPTVGSNVTYTVTAHEQRPVRRARGDRDRHAAERPHVRLVDAFDGHLHRRHRRLGDRHLADTATATLSLVATVNSSQALINQASVTAQAEVDPNRSNNSALVAVNASGLADVQLQQTVDDDTPASLQNVTFTVTAHNAGPTAATNVFVTEAVLSGLSFVSATPSQGTYDPFGASWNVGTIASGATPTLTLVLTVPTTAPIVRIVQKTQSEPDYATENDTDSTSLNDNTVADLAMSLVASQEPVPQGATFSYTIVVSNHGPATATGVTVTDALPAGVTLNSATATQGSCSGTTTVSCNLGTLLDGLSANVVLVVTKTVGGNVSNTASVTATETDPFMPNNSNSETSTPAELTNFRVE